MAGTRRAVSRFTLFGVKLADPLLDAHSEHFRSDEDPDQDEDGTSELAAPLLNRAAQPPSHFQADERHPHTEHGDGDGGREESHVPSAEGETNHQIVDAQGGASQHKYSQAGRPIHPGGVPPGMEHGVQTGGDEKPSAQGSSC